MFLSSTASHLDYVWTMARIRSLALDNTPARPPRTEVDCIYTVTFSDDGTKLLRLATLGSDLRKSTPKPSQIIEIDSVMAAELVQIFKETFGVS